ncbi:MAG: vanadium-dependent haloperoxidase [Ignavibacteria bacterium]|nr:vanadium-dependent haloperoxidase [Ignavibacteria bacterium]
MKKTFIFTAVLILCSLTMTKAELPTVGLMDSTGAGYIHDWNLMIANITMIDGFSPAVSKRNCTYPNIAAYEAARVSYGTTFRSLAGQIKDLKEFPTPKANVKLDARVSAIQAYRTVVNKLLYRSNLADSMYQAQLHEIETGGTPKDVIKHSIEFGESCGKHVITWMKDDGHIKNQSRPRYNFVKGEENWEPTPPDFPDPLDPYFGTMRTLALDSVNQFKPRGPLPFSKEKGSPFYDQNMQVYVISKGLTKEHELIGRYWDDSPIKSFHEGHFMFNTKQISPGGHWINITGIALKMKNKTMMESISAYVLVSVSMFDGFISCWKEKYRSNTIRPITYINRYIDSSWRPLFATPPFPEHTSGHSTISMCAAQMLTNIFGDNMGFVDDTEVRFGFTKRTFKSFLDAAQEVTMSRIYAGIHYFHACNEAMRNGKEISDHIFEKIVLREKGK